MRLKDIFTNKILSRYVMRQNKADYALMKERSLASYPDYFKR